MVEAQLYFSKYLSVTSAKMTYRGVVYPISAVTSVEVRPVSDAPKAGALVYLAMAGVAIIIIVSNQIWAGAYGPAAVGLALLAVCGWFGYRSLRTIRTLRECREVHIRLSSGDTVVVPTASAVSAQKVHSALDRALTASSSSPESGISVAAELEKLAALRDSGVLTEADWTRAKGLYLGQPEDQQSATVDQLRRLYSLHREGVLSESEFNSKKWDVLASR